MRGGGQGAHRQVPGPQAGGGTGARDTGHQVHPEHAGHHQGLQDRTGLLRLPGLQDGGAGGDEPGQGWFLLAGEWRGAPRTDHTASQGDMEADRPQECGRADLGVPRQGALRQGHGGLPEGREGEEGGLEARGRGQEGALQGGTGGQGGGQGHPHGEDREAQGRGLAARGGQLDEGLRGRPEGGEAVQGRRHPGHRGGREDEEGLRRGGHHGAHLWLRQGGDGQGEEGGEVDPHGDEA